MVGRTKAFVYWSMYVRAASERALKQQHLPPIAAALESVECEWDIDRERDDPGFFRIVTYQNLSARSVKDIVIPVLRRAYRLSTEWKITGLESLSSNALIKIHGDWSADTSSSPNALGLDSIVFEIERGQIRRASRDDAAPAGWSAGAWKVVGASSHPRAKKRGRKTRPAGKGTVRSMAARVRLPK